MSRPSLPAVMVAGSCVAAVGSLFAGVWLVFGLGWALIAVAPLFAFLAWLASTLAPDDTTPEPDKPSSVAAAPPIRIASDSTLPAGLTPRVPARA